LIVSGAVIACPGNSGQSGKRSLISVSAHPEEPEPDPDATFHEVPWEVSNVLKTDLQIMTV